MDKNLCARKLSEANATVVVLNGRAGLFSKPLEQRMSAWLIGNYGRMSDYVQWQSPVSDPPMGVTVYHATGLPFDETKMSLFRRDFDKVPIHYVKSQEEAMNILFQAQLSKEQLNPRRGRI